MVADRFRLRYKLTPDHFQTYLKLAAKRAKTTYSWKPILIIALAAAASGLMWVALQKAGMIQIGEKWIVLGGLAFIGIFALLAFVMAYSGIMRQMVGDHDVVIGKFTLAAYDAGGLQITGTHMQSSFDWTAFIDMTQAKDMLIIWVDIAVGVIIPNKAFADDSERQQFTDFVQERIDAHKQTGD